MNTIDIIALVAIMIMFLMGTHLTVVFSIGSIIILMTTMGFPLGNIAQIFFSSIASYPLLAMPFFILAGNIILRCKGMMHLRDLLNALVGHLPGGMAVAMLIFAVFLGSVSGSAGACLVILGTIFVPMLVDAGYSRAFSSAIAVTSAGLGAVIPPSVFLIVFGSSNRISISELFIGGIGPGVLAGLLMIGVAVYISHKRNYKNNTKIELSDTRLRIFLRALPIVLLPAVVLGGIYSGIFSPTQAAAVSVFYSLFISFVIYGDFTLQQFMDALVDTTKLSSMIYFLVIGGELFGKVLGYIGLPQMISQIVIDMALGPFSFMIVVQIFLIFLGFFFSSFPMVIIVLPLFLPSVYALGIDPVLYGVLTIFCSIIGEVTPPMGPQLWIAGPVCGEKIGNIMRESWVFLGAQFITLFLTTLFPQISLFLVELFR